MNLLERIKALPSFLAGGYDGATWTRDRPMASWRGTMAVDEDRQIGSADRQTLRLECANLYRNNPIVRGAVERYADNVVGAGIIAQAKTSDENWNKEAERLFGEWSKVADYRQRVHLRQIQRMAVVSRMLAGESLYILTDGGQIQPVEADRLVTPQDMHTDPQVVDGIRIDRSGIILGYYIGNRDQYGRVDNTTTRYIRKENIIHVSAAYRPDQLRGIPELAPVVTTLADMDLLTKATLQKAKLDANNGVAIKTQEGAAKMPATGLRNNTPNAYKATDPQYETINGLRVYYIRPGEDIQSLASATPSSTYIPYNEFMLRLVGSSLGLPSEMLMLDFRQSSFSSNKAAMAQVYRTFVNWNYWLVESFMQRLWNWRIAKFIKDGQLSPAPIDDRGISEWYRVEWSQPDYSYLDPEGSIDAKMKEWNLGIGSISQFARLRGSDGDDALAAKVRDIQTAYRIADQANAQTPGLNLRWQDVIASLMPGQQPAPTEPPAGAVDAAG